MADGFNLCYTARAKADNLVFLLTRQTLYYFGTEEAIHMQCPTCGAILPSDTNFCYSCGARILTVTPPPTPNVEISELPAGAAEYWQENSTFISGSPSGPQFRTDEAPAAVASPLPGSAESYGGTDWNQFNSGLTPAGAGSVYSPPQPTPGMGEYVYGPSAGNYPYIPGYQPGSLPPQFVPPVMPAPKSKRSARAIIGSLLVLLVIFGAFFVGIQIGQSHSKTGSIQTSTLATSAATSTVAPSASTTPDANQLYQQTTSQTPTYADPLTNATLSQWETFTMASYSCGIQSDGLHVSIKDTGKFTYCTSGRGQFSSFAFQVSMKIVAGSGGLTFRGDTTAGSYYYFHVYPDGSYHIYAYKNHTPGAMLGGGTINSFISGFNQENTLTVIAVGKQIDFYANQKFVTEIQDSTYSTGYVGVLAEDATSPAEVVYTNARIWALQANE